MYRSTFVFRAVICFLSLAAEIQPFSTAPPPSSVAPRGASRDGPPAGGGYQSTGLSLLPSRCTTQRRRTQFSTTTTTKLQDNKIRGDPLREASGIRPSLHPLTINTVAELLKVRARRDPGVPLRVTDDGVQPLQVALQAGRIAAEAIQKRQGTSEQDGMTLNAEEQQTVAGRIVGVAMRLHELEAALVAKCQEAGWVAKYAEWDSFGVLAEENDDDDDKHETAVDQRIKDDPLFAMNRAECLLALFLQQVEAPELAEKKLTVPDNSEVDFLDSDRKKVLLGVESEDFQ